MESILQEILEKAVKSAVGEKGFDADRGPCPMYAPETGGAFAALMALTGHPTVTRLRDRLKGGWVTGLDDVLETEWAELKLLVQQLDRWGTLVYGLRGLHFGPKVDREDLAACRADLLCGVTLFVQQHLPWQLAPALTAGNLARHLCDGRDGIKAQLRLRPADAGAYRFEVDLWDWVAPRIRRGLLVEMGPAVRHALPSVDWAEAESELKRAACGLLAHLAATFGIRGIEVDDWFEAALLTFVTLVFDHPAHPAGVPRSLLRAALGSETEVLIRSRVWPAPFSTAPPTVCAGDPAAEKRRSDWFEAEKQLRRWWLDTHWRMSQ